MHIPTRIAIYRVMWCTKLLAPLYRTKPVRPRPNLRSWGLSSVPAYLPVQLYSCTGTSKHPRSTEYMYI